MTRSLFADFVHSFIKICIFHLNPLVVAIAIFDLIHIAKKNFLGVLQEYVLRGWRRGRSALEKESAVVQNAFPFISGYFETNSNSILLVLQFRDLKKLKAGPCFKMWEARWPNG